MARTKQTARKTTSDKAPSRRQFHERSTAVADAWAITEIAENILAHLPMKDLLLVQRVSSGWRELIKSSPTLQELLFMRPRQIQAGQNISSDSIPIREFNPLLVEHMPLWFSAGDAYFQTVKDAPWAESVSRLVFLRQDASWRHMLLAQPPFTAFESVRRVHAMGGDSLSVGCIDQPDGVRMGLAYDKTVHPIKEGHSTLPNSFHTLMDGRTAHDAQVPSVQDDVQGDLETQERIFGGVNKFTLFFWTTRGCTGPTYEQMRKMRLEQRQFTSAGFESVDIVLHEVNRHSASRDRFSWWTEDGYRR
ncbi:hypothetical protein F4808DRAFT_269081 [Astrocystis sublimbata]|nr:hypothetical protein F4808DRAFT_269081 [Astrocystis sublimbata]